MNDIIEIWLHDQIEECPEHWEFPDDFDKEKALDYLRCNLDYSLLTDHLDNLLLEFLR